jgi:hypothetical protein
MTQQYRATSQGNEKVANDMNSTFPQGPGWSQASVLDLQSTGRDSGASRGRNGGSLLRGPENLRQRWESIQVGFARRCRRPSGGHRVGAQVPPVRDRSGHLVA